MLGQINVIKMLQIQRVHQNQNVAVMALTVNTSDNCNSRYV